MLLSMVGFKKASLCGLLLAGQRVCASIGETSFEELEAVWHSQIGANVGEAGGCYEAVSFRLYSPMFFT